MPLKRVRCHVYLQPTTIKLEYELKVTMCDVQIIL